MKWDEFVVPYARIRRPLDRRLVAGDAAHAVRDVASAALDDRAATLPGWLQVAASQEGGELFGELLRTGLILEEQGWEWGEHLLHVLQGAPVIARAEYATWVDTAYSKSADAYFAALSPFEDLLNRAFVHPDEYRTDPLTIRREAFVNDLGVRLQDVDAELLASSSQLLIDTSFHAVQRNAERSWSLLLHGQRPRASDGTDDGGREWRDRARFLFAARALEMFELRRALGDPRWRHDANVVQARSVLNGCLAEIDVAIALFGLMGEPECRFAVVPAPPQFEAVAGAANADFIVIDLPERRARGIQVKSTARGVAHRDYDDARVSVVYAAEDLGSMVPDPHSVGGIARTVPTPGLFAMRFLSVQRPTQLVMPFLTEERTRNIVRRAERALIPAVSDAGRSLNLIAAGGAHGSSGYQRAVREAKETTRAQVLRVESRLLARVRGALAR